MLIMYDRKYQDVDYTLFEVRMMSNKQFWSGSDSETDTKFSQKECYNACVWE